MSCFINKTGKARSQRKMSNHGIVYIFIDMTTLCSFLLTIFLTKIVHKAAKEETSFKCCWDKGVGQTRVIPWITRK